MKTTLELPDQLVREAKVRAAREGTTLRAVVARALEEELRQHTADGTEEPVWKRHFGALSCLHDESEAVLKDMQAEFGNIEAEAWE